MSELKPCPFCGGEARTSGERFENTILSWVFCSSCGAAGGYRHTEAEAITAWNTRAERTCHDVKPSLPFFKCDSCGMEDMGGTELWIQDGFYRSQKPNYCPNCGAKVVDE